MNFYERYGSPLAPASPTREYTDEQIAKREAILDMPMDIPRPVQTVDEMLDFERKYETTSLRNYTPDRSGAQAVAISEDSVLAAIPNYFAKELKFSESDYPADPNFNPNDHLYGYDLVSPDYYDELSAAQSEEEFAARVQYFGKISKDSGYLDQLGVEGIGYRAAAFMADIPVLKVMSLLSRAGKLATVASAVEKSYVGRALATGVAEGSLEGIKKAVAPHSRDEVDIMLAIGLGGVLGGLYRPAAYSDGIQEGLTNPIRTLANDVAEGGDILRTPESTARLIDKVQLNVASVLRNSPSSTLSKFGDDMFLDVTQKMDTRVKAAEMQTAVIDSIQAEFGNLFHPLYLEFLEATGKSKLGARYRMTSQQEFYELAGKIARDTDTAWDELYPPELVAKIRKANDDMGKKAYDILERNNHPLFKEGQITREDNWLPRRWNRSKLIQDINEGVLKRSDAEKMFEQGIRKAIQDAGLEVAEDKAKEAGKKFVHTLTKPQLRAGDAGYILEDNAFRTAFEDISRVLDLDDDEVRLLEDALQGRREARGAAEGTAASTRGRGDIDINTNYIDELGNEHKLLDYLENDVQTLWQSYGRQMGGDTALRSIGIQSRTELARLRDQVVKELSDSTGQIPADRLRDLENFDAVIGDMLGVSGKYNPEGSSWKLTRTINNLVRSSKLGSTWFAMSAEVAQATYVNGVVNTIKAMPVMNQLRKQLKGGKANELLEEIQSFYGLSHEIIQMPSSARWEDVMRTGGKKGLLDTAEEFSDRAAEAAYMLGGTKSGTSIGEAVFATAANNKLIKMAGKQRLSAHDKWYLEQMGFQGDEAKALLQSVKEYSGGANKYMMNLDKWADPDQAMKLAYGIRRISHIAIQKGNIGDQMGRWTIGGTLAKDSMMGALGLNLRNYMVTAWNKQFSRMVGQFGRGGQERWEAFKNMTYQGVIVGGLGYMGKVGLDYATGAIDEDKFEERMTPQAIAANTFSMTTFASFLPAIIEAPYQGFTGERLTGSAARGNEFAFGGATEGYVKDVFGAGQTTLKALNPDREVTAYEARKAISTLPLSSAIGVKQAIANLSEMITED